MHPYIGEHNNTAMDISMLRNMMQQEIETEKALCSPNMPLVHEAGLLGAGLGGGFNNAKELRPIKYKEAISGADKEQWIKAIDEEWERMAKHNVFKAMKRKDVPEDENIVTNTWAMKKKASGRFRARTNARGYEQVDGIHFLSTDTSSPIVNDVSIKIIFV